MKQLDLKENLQFNCLRLMAFVMLLCQGVFANAQGFTEDFDNVATLAGNDWSIINHSQTIGISTWYQGNTLFYSFNAYNGSANAYVAADFHSSTGTGAISDWLIGPNRTFNNGDTIRFYTRTYNPVSFPDRLQLRFSTNGTSTNIGATWTEVGDFTTVFQDINPLLTTVDYPVTWTLYQTIISGLSGPTSGRFAFRYYVQTNAGPAGNNSYYIGIDHVEYAPNNCFTTTCHNDTTIYADANNCATVVSFVPPTGSYSCSAPPDTFFFTGQIDTFTVPAGVTSARIEVRGAQGGNNQSSVFGPGLGAIMAGDFVLSPGSQLKILVGEQPSLTFGNGNGGGGGSFVTDLSNNPLIVAGGGAGSSDGNYIFKDAQAGTSGADGPAGGGLGGINGNGGGVGASFYQSGGGGGLLTDGASGSDGPTSGGKAFVNGGAGATNNAHGGFGGGGGGSYSVVGGAGGGYSGGGSGSNSVATAMGGGGGSYNAGTNQSNTGGANTGHGMVIITPLPQPVITSTLMAGLAPGSSFPVGTTTETYRIDDGLGDTAYCTFNITVVDTATPTIICPNNVTTCTSVVTGIAPTVSGTNACSNITYTLTGATTGTGADDASGTNFNAGLTIVKYKVANLNGNADSCSFTVTINNPSGLLAGNNASPESVNYNVVAPADVRYTDCDLIASLTPSGANPEGGNTIFKVTIDNAIQNYNGQPYVQRHYDIEPNGNIAANATATITLYAYQYEFDAYNLAAGPLGLPLLPTGGLDNGNVRISQFHGVGTAPGNYPGSEELIVPSVSWDNVYNHWVMTFDVSGFSGFYIHTSWSGPLAIEISDISAINKGSRNRVDWSTASETAGDIMTLERSTDGKTFTALTDMYATGKASNYSYWDGRAAQGINYYRVRLTNAAHKQTYTKVVSATVKSGGALAIAANPNPVTDKVNVQVSGLAGSNGMIEVTDPTGKRLVQVAAQGNNTLIDMSGMPSGIYFIKYTDADGSVTTRVNKL